MVVARGRSVAEAFPYQPFHVWDYDGWAADHPPADDPAGMPQRGLSDPTVGPDGRRIAPADWPARRQDIQRRIDWLLGDGPAYQPAAVSFGEGEPHEVAKVMARDWPAAPEKGQCRFGDGVNADLYYPSAEAAGAGVKLPGIVWLGPFNCSGGYVGSYRAGDVTHVRIARAGFVVLAFDPIGTGTRQFERRDFYQRHPSWSLMGRMVRDARWAIDVLSQCPDVDPRRIALFGYAMGGQTALLTAALDDRAAAAVSVAGFTPFRGDTDARGAGGVRRYSHLYGWLPRLGAFVGQESCVPVDFDEVLSAIAPRPALVVAPRLDWHRAGRGRCPGRAARAAGVQTSRRRRPVRASRTHGDQPTVRCDAGRGAGVGEGIDRLNGWRIVDRGLPEIEVIGAEAGGVRVRGPGLVDLQVNGYAGVDFNAPAERLSADGLHRAAESMRRRGVAAALITLITDEPAAMLARAARLADLCRADARLGGFYVGLHVEGPFLSPEDGPRGAHPAAHVTSPAARPEFIPRLLDAAGDWLRMVSLAPESPGAIGLIRQLARHGVVPAIGHTAASADSLAEAVAAGARLSAHLGNGSHGLLPRLDNYVQYQLSRDDLPASFIADGVHMPFYTLKNFLRAKGWSRSILVTDATAAADAGPGRYTVAALEIESDAAGRVCLAGRATLAGSSLRLDRAVANVHYHCGVGLAEAWRMASQTPAELIGLAPRPTIEALVTAEGFQEVRWNVLRELRAGRMLVCVYADKRSLASAAAAEVARTIRLAVERKGFSDIVVATGASQFEFLEELVRQDIPWPKVRAFHLDEYLGLPRHTPPAFGDICGSGCSTALGRGR